MGWTALLRADLLSLSRSWVLKGWIIVLALTGLVSVGAPLAAARTMPVPASGILATQLDAFLMIWSTVIIVLAAGSVSVETDIVADSILSRSCTRIQYIGAKLLSRMLVITSVYLIYASAVAYAAWRYAANDMTLGTMALAIGIVGMAVLLLSALGVAMSTLFNSTIFAVIGLILLWYVASPIFTFAGADYLSPASLVRNLPRILKDANAPQVIDAHAEPSSIRVTFSKELDARSAEQAANYLIEGRGKERYTPQTAVYDPAKTTVLLGGLHLPAGERLRVTARGITDKAGNEISPAADAIEVTVQADRSAPSQSAAGAATGAPHRPTAAAPRVTRCVAVGGSLRVTFSAEMNRKDVEDPLHYVVECPPGSIRTPAYATWNADTRSVLLSGLDLPAGEQVKVTVRDVRDASGAPVSEPDSWAVYSEVTPWKYLLGFGIPTVGACVLALFWFCRRDL
ncbi:MAG: ABC transporter permease [Chthonomonadales bacterium]